MSGIYSAYFDVCNDAVKVTNQRWFVSLYVKAPFYGGPEEGGWWGTDRLLVATYEVPSEEMANTVVEKIEGWVSETNDDAKREHDEVNLQLSINAEQKSYDSPEELYGEDDGVEEYYVVIENNVGQNEHRDDRHYN
jgi:hypothetical protein